MDAAWNSVESLSGYFVGSTNVTVASPLLMSKKVMSEAVDLFPRFLA